MRDSFYDSKEWHRLRAIVRKRRVCAICGGNTIGKYNAHVDHIQPRRLFPELALNLNNLQLLCNRCHNSTKQLWEKGRGLVPVNADGTPSDPEHPWNLP